MKVPSIGALSFGFIGLTALVLTAIGAPNSRVVPPVAAPEAPLPVSVSANGFTLVSASIDLPVDEAQYPVGPHADVINANCTSCHSASMALSQPALSPEQWKAEVTKMREVFDAPVAEADVPAIVSYLTAMPSQKAAPGTAKAQDPGPKVAPDISGSSG